MNKRIAIYVLAYVVCGLLGAAIMWRSPTVGLYLGGLLWLGVAVLAYKVKNSDFNADWALLGYVWSAATGVLTVWLLSFGQWFLSLLALWNLCTAGMPLALLAIKATRN